MYFISGSRAGRKAKHFTQRGSDAVGDLQLLLMHGGAGEAVRCGVFPQKGSRCCPAADTLSPFFRFFFLLLPLISWLLFQPLFFFFFPLPCPLSLLLFSPFVFFSPHCFGLIFLFLSCLFHYLGKLLCSDSPKRSCFSFSMLQLLQCTHTMKKKKKRGVKKELTTIQRSMGGNTLCTKEQIYVSTCNQFQCGSTTVWPVIPGLHQAGLLFN